MPSLHASPGSPVPRSNANRPRVGASIPVHNLQQTLQVRDVPSADGHGGGSQGPGGRGRPWRGGAGRAPNLPSTYRTGPPRQRVDGCAPTRGRSFTACRDPSRPLPSRAGERGRNVDARGRPGIMRRPRREADRRGARRRGAAGSGGS
jgi:hypothetical protein